MLLRRWNSKRDPAKHRELLAFLATPEAHMLSDREVARRFLVGHQLVGRLRPKLRPNRVDDSKSRATPGCHTSHRVDDSSQRPSTEAGHPLKPASPPRPRAGRSLVGRLQMTWRAPDGTRVEVRPDRIWPGMFRVHHRGRTTDMVNLTRARDAAQIFAEVAE
jgi:hypothetical protein